MHVLLFPLHFCCLPFVVKQIDKQMSNKWTDIVCKDSMKRNCAKTPWRGTGDLQPSRQLAELSWRLCFVLFVFSASSSVTSEFLFIHVLKYTIFIPHEATYSNEFYSRQMVSTILRWCTPHSSHFRSMHFMLQARTLSGLSPEHNVRKMASDSQAFTHWSPSTRRSVPLELLVHDECQEFEYRSMWTPRSVLLELSVHHECQDFAHGSLWTQKSVLLVHNKCQHFELLSWQVLLENKTEQLVLSTGKATSECLLARA